MNISFQKAWTEIKNSFTKICDFVFNYNVLDERLLIRHKYMVVGLFVFWVLFIIGFKFCAIYIPEMDLDTKLCNSLLPLWVCIILLMIKNIFLNMLTITSFANVKRQLNKFEQARKSYEVFREHLNILGDNLQEELLKQKNDTRDQATKYKNWSLYLARYMRLNAYIVNFQRKYPNFRTKNREGFHYDDALGTYIIRYFSFGLYHELTEFYIVYRRNIEEALRANMDNIVAFSIVERVMIIDDDNIYSNIEELAQFIYNMIIYTP